MSYIKFNLELRGIHCFKSLFWTMPHTFPNERVELLSFSSFFSFFLHGIFSFFLSLLFSSRFFPFFLLLAFSSGVSMNVYRTCIWIDGLVLLVTFSISVDVQGYHVMARRKKETVLKKVLKHERKTSPKANIPGPPVLDSI